MESKISVIVPVYKVESYLHRCVNSIINQTHKNLEIILINDGSPDNSGKICDELAAKDNRIIVIHKKNEGSSCARNAGLDIATGNYISFVDSDDYINELMLECMLSGILKHNLDVVEISLKDESNRIFNFETDFVIEDKISAMTRVIKNTAFSVWRRLYKASVIQDLRFIPKIIHQDVFYTLDVLNKIDQIGYIKNHKFYYYNTSNESIIRSKYSLEKIKIGIKATEYIVNNTPQVPNLQETVTNYVTYYYTDHFFKLSRNTSVDPDKVFRKKLRNTIFKNLNSKNINIRSLLVVMLPIKVMEFVTKSITAINKASNNIP